MLLTSKYPGTCTECGSTYAVGARVSWQRGVEGARHAACSSEGRAAAERVIASRAAAPAEVVASAAPADVVAPPGRHYLPYQVAGIQAMAAHPEGSLLADEMGLGKTIQAIGLLNTAPGADVLIIAPKSLERNWRRELAAWLVDGRTVGDETGAADIVVTTYERAKKHADVLSARAWAILIVDEAHYCKNPKSQRSKAVARLAARAARVIALTGTPILNRPVELHPLLSLVAPRAWNYGGKGFFPFALRYCAAHKTRVARNREVWDFSGASNLPELQQRLRETCMVRRLKQDVLAELPAKRRQVVEIAANGSSALLRHEKAAIAATAVTATLRTVDAASYDDAIRALRGDTVAFAEMAALRAEIGLAKAPAVAEHVAMLLESEAKVLVFAHHRAVITALAAALEEHGVVTVTGEHDAAERQAAVDAFQRENGPRVFVGQIQAAGVGLTLTAASTVVMAELPWTPGELTQAEDRAHRIGQRSAVLVQHVVYEDSLDAHIARILIAKQSVATAGLDTVPEPAPEPAPER